MSFAIFFQKDVKFNWSPIKGSIFYPFQRTLWTLGLWWLSYACLSGKAQLINRFLSLSMFQLLAKINYSTYLVHHILIVLDTSYKRVGIYFSAYEAVRLTSVATCD